MTRREWCIECDTNLAAKDGLCHACLRAAATRAREEADCDDDA